MSMLIAKEVNGINYHVQRMTVREIYDLFDQAVRKPEDDAPVEPESPDWIGNTLFEEVTIRDILTFTDLIREQIMEMYPVDVEGIIAEVKKENPHFFAACGRLEKAGKQLDRVLIESASSASGLPSLP